MDTKRSKLSRLNLNNKVMSFSELMKAEIGEELYRICDSGDISTLQAYYPIKKSFSAYNKTSQESPVELPLSQMMEIAARNNDVSLIQYCLRAGGKKKLTPAVLQRIQYHRPHKVWEAILATDPYRHGIIYSGRNGIYCPNREMGDMVSFAAVDDDMDWVRLCFAHGASATNGEIGEYCTVLAGIAANASVEMAAFWLQQEVALGGKVELNDSDAIGSAAEAGRCDMVEFLLEKGADINEVCNVYKILEHSLYRDEKAGSPLHRAIRNDKYDMLRLLLKRGADVNLQDVRGRTPLSLARERGDYELVERLREHGAKK